MRCTYTSSRAKEIFRLGTLRETGATLARYRRAVTASITNARSRARFFFTNGHTDVTHETRRTALRRARLPTHDVIRDTSSDHGSHTYTHTMNASARARLPSRSLLRSLCLSFRRSQSGRGRETRVYPPARFSLVGFSRSCEEADTESGDKQYRSECNVVAMKMPSDDD